MSLGGTVTQSCIRPARRRSISVSSTFRMRHRYLMAAVKPRAWRCTRRYRPSHNKRSACDVTSSADYFNYRGVIISWGGEGRSRHVTPRRPWRAGLISPGLQYISCRREFLIRADACLKTSTTIRRWVTQSCFRKSRAQLMWRLSGSLCRVDTAKVHIQLKMYDLLAADSKSKQEEKIWTFMCLD